MPRILILTLLLALALAPQAAKGQTEPEEPAPAEVKAGEAGPEAGAQAPAAEEPPPPGEEAASPEPMPGEPAAEEPASQAPPPGEPPPGEPAAGPAVEGAEPEEELPPVPVPDRPAHELFTAGMEAVAAGDLATALEKLEGAVAAAPDNLRYGAEYRQAAIAVEEYDRSIKLFKRLVAQYPEAVNARMNYAYAFVDKIPSAGAITQVILANTALTHFTAALEQEETWLVLYTRGNSYIYWPPIFGRARLGIADLEKAVEMSRGLPDRSYFALAYAALGDGYWRVDEVEKARAIWRQGLERFPGDERLTTRLEKSDEDLRAFLSEHFDTNTRVGTDLRELWQAGWQEACTCDPEAGG